jgi:N-acetylglucosaminyldiphosphoundecaprenol N-acetyl-beta-D-mannosaminyltransferase
VGIDPIRRDELIPRVEALVEESGQATVAYANVHVLNQAQSHPHLAAFLNSLDLCYCDGNGVVKGARILGSELPERMTGADWIWDLAATAEGRLRLYWIGGDPGVTHAAAQRLRDKHPKLEIFTDHGFHAREGPEDEKCIHRINEARPHIVLVGMGTPTQEAWVAERRARIDSPVVWCLGATADFVSGRVKRVGPQWLIENHEWASRLLADPGRLWKRYLIGNALFLARVAAQRRRRT